jgi:plasmid stability protein
MAVTGRDAAAISVMAQVLVRNLDEQVVSVLRRKAELHGHSLEQELRMTLTAAARLTGVERAALARRIRGMSPRMCSRLTARS